MRSLRDTRVAVLALAIVVLFPRDAEAVIPGLAPGFVAILPQLLLFLVTTMALLFSPRTWWRALVAAARRPLWSAATLIVCVGIVAGGSQLLARLPRPTAGAELASSVAGFAIGDAAAGRVRGHGVGPLASPRVDVLRAPSSGGVALPETVSSLAPFDGGVSAAGVPGEGALGVGLDRRTIFRIDAQSVTARWSSTLPGSLAADPLAFRRVRSALAGARDDDETESVVANGIVALYADDGGVLALALLDGENGATIGQLELESLAGPASIALVDERLVIAGSRSIACVTIADPGRPSRLWSAARRPGRVVGLCGDESGRYFLLDETALAVGDLAGGEPVDLARLDGLLPARLAARSGRAYVLATETDDSAAAQLLCVDPAMPGRPVWSVRVDRPVLDEIAAGPPGVVLTLADRIEIRDPLIGSTRSRMPLPAAPRVAAVLGGLSCFVALDDGRIVRCSPALGGVEWSVDSASGAIAGLVVAGDRLVASAGDGVCVVSSAGEDDLPWSHAGGSAARRGTCDPEEAPLSAELLWSRPAVVAGAPIDARGAIPLPLDNDWVVVAGSASGCRIERLAARDGRSIAEMTVDGKPLGAVRLGRRVVVALHRPEGDAVVCLDAGVEGSRLATLWEVTVDGLAGPAPLVATRDQVVVSLEAALVSLSALDGTRRWRSAAAPGASSPVVTGGLVVVSASREAAGDTLVALELAGGDLAWERRAEKGSWGAPSASEDLSAPLRSDGATTLVALDTTDGTPLRQRELAVEVEIPLAIGEDGVVTRSVDGATLFASWDGDVARVQRTEPVSGARDSGAAPIAAFGLVVVADGAAVRAIDPVTLDEVWRVRLPATIGSMAMARGRILALTDGGLHGVGSP